DPGGVLFCIANTGAYISTRERAHLFDPFYRAPAADDNAIQGAGLGLSICKDLVERLGGRLWVESAEAGETTFFFTVPGARQDSAQRLERESE
ncbi:MAG: sensor histidine kinase, partial [Ktedonobacterales bacterium]